MLDEGKWDKRRRLLAARAPHDVRQLPGFDLNDRHFWLRAAVRNALSPDRKNLDRLVNDDPTFENYVLRSRVRNHPSPGLPSDHLGCLSDELAAERLAGRFAWYFVLDSRDSTFPARLPSELEVAVRTERPSSEYELVVAWSDRWIASGRSANLARGLALYRLDRLEEAVKQLENVKAPDDKRPTASILVRAMARKRLGQETESKLDHEKVKRLVEKWDGAECFEVPLREEAKKLLEP
jgi:hypothetical protein